MKLRRLALALAVGVLTACGGPGDGPPVSFTVPSGATFREVSDTLVQRGLVGAPGLFGLYARLRGADRRVKAGGYVVARDASWGDLLDILSRGRVATRPLTIPEGFRIPQIADRIAELSGVSRDSVLTVLDAPDADSVFGVPGPGLEGYLFPDTYRFAPGVPPREVVQVMVDRYEAIWTPERRRALDSLGMTERQAVTLASIVQAEARRTEEMPRIASVYHNRLDRRWLLQADPTVLYALGGPRERLLYAAIDSVQDNPYNTYTQPGLPPGPIGSPGEAALDATLHPADEGYMYFVARPDGTHVFTRTLDEHNRAKADSRQAWDSLRRSGDGEG
jgi:UPF0755 protein